MRPGQERSHMRQTFIHLIDNDAQSKTKKTGIDGYGVFPIALALGGLQEELSAEGRRATELVLPGTCISL
ncbi:hypothetical protein AJ79_02515 [Helicocarpus griseus UAMH5409]|uniref:Uncharacterized protein n=1 Tax=Helicocarpus griseus UAMH5409 TaxID=1447875 RepID=A0A2B7Y2J0_9EURO|nr:hypothetical protein AJ79_02515 [Helicocarpus griseus UAMH5409]